MMQGFGSMPLPFFLTLIALAFFLARGWKGRRQAWGIPTCAVLGTVAVWYVGDAFYNDYRIYQLVIDSASLASAWWQVLLFVVVFGLLAKPISEKFNSHLANNNSRALVLMETERLLQPKVQRQVDIVAAAMLFAWILLMIIAVIKVKGDVLGLFAPYLGHKTNPWARGQIGGGFSAIISLAAYFQIFLTAAFGVIAAIALNPKTRNMALAVCLLALPFYIFDRTRNTMLATMMPGILAFVFLRLRRSKWVKLGFLVAAFLAVNTWFTFVMASRGSGMSVSSSFVSEEIEEADIETTKHLGLNMFEELAWINHLFETGRYRPEWGRRYFAELVNPIPRGLWKNKPTIGLDYAIARGQSTRGDKGEVTATISTGMIGQGVVNYGPFLGPIAAALLMGFWVALLARQDLKGDDPGRLILYGCGLILTFNLGRDITLLVLYPFLFGLIAYWFWNRYLRKDHFQKEEVYPPPSSNNPLPPKKNNP